MDVVGHLIMLDGNEASVNMIMQALAGGCWFGHKCKIGVCDTSKEGLYEESKG